METVFIVISVLNGYKNIEMVFGNKEVAEGYVKLQKEDPRFSRHEFYVCEYNVN